MPRVPKRVLDEILLRGGHVGAFGALVPPRDVLSLALDLKDAQAEIAKLKRDAEDQTAGRDSLAQEIRQTLRVRDFYASERASDLIGCVARALEGKSSKEARAEIEVLKGEVAGFVNDAQRRGAKR